MKLKKIASLALAGIMAVSMLTACGEGGKKEEDPSSSEITTINGAAEALNSVLSRNEGVVEFKSDSELDKNLEAYYRVRPIKADEWTLQKTEKIIEAVDSDFKTYVDVINTGSTKFTNVLKNDTTSFNGSVALVGMFNTTRYTQAEALKYMGTYIDNIDFAEDTSNKTDGDVFTYDGTASVLKVESEKGAASVWVVVAVIDKDYAAI